MAKFKNRKITSSNFNYNPKFQSILPKHEHPIFCFRHTHPKYCVESCDDTEKINLISQLSNLSKLTWNEIRLSPKNGMGSEKISINSLNVKCPSFITGDVDFLLSFRFYGKMPFLVWRDQFLAHIIFIDPKGDVYDH